MFSCSPTPLHLTAEAQTLNQNLKHKAQPFYEATRNMRLVALKKGGLVAAVAAVALPMLFGATVCLALGIAFPPVSHILIPSALLLAITTVASSAGIIRFGLRCIPNVSIEKRVEDLSLFAFIRKDREFLNYFADKCKEEKSRSTVDNPNLLPLYTIWRTTYREPNRRDLLLNAYTWT